jgi:hypothetical protein
MQHTCRPSGGGLLSTAQARSQWTGTVATSTPTQWTATAKITWSRTAQSFTHSWQLCKKKLLHSTLGPFRYMQDMRIRQPLPPVLLCRRYSNEQVRASHTLGPQHTCQPTRQHSIGQHGKAVCCSAPTHPSKVIGHYQHIPLPQKVHPMCCAENMHMLNTCQI